jgi:hypothetical protein
MEEEQDEEEWIDAALPVRAFWSVYGISKRATKSSLAWRCGWASPLTGAGNLISASKTRLVD